MEVTFYERKTKEGRIRAFADVEVADGITVRGFRIVDGPTGLFVAGPSKPLTVNGEVKYINQIWFHTMELRERILSQVLERYHAWQGARADAGQSSQPRPEAGMRAELDSTPPF